MRVRLLPLLLLACAHDRRDAERTLRLAERSATSDPAQAAALYEKACELGDGRGCARRGLAANDAAWLQRAEPLLQRGCADGEPEHCELAAAIATARSAEPKPADAAARAVAAYDAACAASDADACLREGVLLDEGKLVPRDAPRALARLLRACDAGLAGGCAAAGLKFLRGEDVAADAARSRELLRRAKALSQSPDAGS